MLIHKNILYWYELFDLLYGIWYEIFNKSSFSLIKKKKKNTGGGSHSLPQGIFQTKGLNPGLLQCR